MARHSMMELVSTQTPGVILLATAYITIIPKLSFQETPLDGLTRGSRTGDLRINQGKLDCFASGSSYSNGTGTIDAGSIEASDDRSILTHHRNRIIQESNPNEDEGPRTESFDEIHDHILKA